MRTEGKPVAGPRWEEAHIRNWLHNAGHGSLLPPVGWFGDSEDQTDELAELVCQGKKRATAGLLWRWEEKGGAPREGDRQVIVDWQGKPRAVIEMTNVRVVPFNEVDADFAAEEGEGDLSLDHWRQVHWGVLLARMRASGPDAH